MRALNSASQWRWIAIVVTATTASQTGLAATKIPNVILIITDDQGYGDMSCHGNPWLKTPNLGRLHAESVCLEDFVEVTLLESGSSSQDDN